MKLDNLKNAWSALVVRNSLESIQESEVLFIIENQVESASVYKYGRILQNVFVFIFLLACCQGG